MPKDSSDSERIARIEEGLSFLREKTDEHHKAMIGLLHPTITEVKEHTKDLTQLKRDRVWVVGLVVAIPALMEFGKKLFSGRS